MCTNPGPEIWSIGCGHLESGVAEGGRVAFSCRVHISLTPRDTGLWTKDPSSLPKCWPHLLGLGTPWDFFISTSYLNSFSISSGELILKGMNKVLIGSRRTTETRLDTVTDRVPRDYRRKQTLHPQGSDILDMFPKENKLHAKMLSP